MKKLFTTTITVAAMAINTAPAQTNLNFESWTGNEPNGWASSNAITQSGGGAQTVFKETSGPGQGNASVKMVTGNCPECPNFSIFGTFGPPTPLPDPLGGSIGLGTFENAGVPYIQRPISVDIKYKSNPMGNDAGGFWIVLERYNQVNDETETVGEGYFESNTQVANWTNANIPIVYYSNFPPDTMNIWATSSVGSIPDLSAFGIPAPQGLPAPVSGSEFYLDAIVFNLPSCTGLSLTVTGTNETSIGANDGTATANPNGGSAPYSYSWSNTATSQSINGLMPGYYYVTVTDVNQCQKVGSYYVAPGGCNLSVSVTGTNSSTNSIYTGNGTATATVSGGNPPYEYTWNTGETTSSVSNLAVGTYALWVVEQSNPNCAVWAYYTVYGPGGPGGINVQSLKNKSSLYPNPSNGKFALEVGNAMKEWSVLEIYNVLGEKIYAISHAQQQTSNEIDLSDFPKSIYFVKIYDSEKIYTEKIVIH